MEDSNNIEKQDSDTKRLEELVTSLQEQVKNQNATIALLQEKSSVNENDEYNEINILDIFFSIIKGWWALILFTLIGAFGTLGYCMIGYTPTYSASAMMYVNNGTKIGSTTISISDLNASQSLVDTYGIILKTHTILDEVSRQLTASDIKNYEQKEYTYYNLVDRVSISAVDETEVFYVTVIDEVIDNAMNIANITSSVLMDVIPQKIDGSSARIIDKVEKGDVTKIASGIPTKVAIGAVVGFVVACVASFIENYFLNDTFYDSKWLTETYPDIPLFGEVPDIAVDSHSGYYKKGYGYGYRYGYKYYRDSYYKSDKNTTTSDSKEAK